MPVATPEFKRRFIEEFRANRGVVRGFEDKQLLLLTYVDGESGENRTTPLGYLLDGGSHAIFATNNGEPEDPSWYHSLMTHPRATIEVGPDTIEVVAEAAEGDERVRLLRTMAARNPGFGDYEKQAAGRVIPVAVLKSTTTA